MYIPLAFALIELKVHGLLFIVNFKGKERKAKESKEKNNEKLHCLRTVDLQVGTVSMQLLPCRFPAYILLLYTGQYGRKNLWRAYSNREGL